MGSRRDVYSTGKAGSRRKAKRPAAKTLLSSPLPAPTAARAFTQCTTAIDLLAVASRSLDAQEIGQEQAALRCAQQALWTVHDFLFPLQGDAAEGDDGEP